MKFIDPYRFSSGVDDPCVYDGCPPPDPNISYAFGSTCNVLKTQAGATIPSSWIANSSAYYGVYYSPTVGNMQNSHCRGTYNIEEIWIPKADTSLNTNYYPWYDCYDLHTVNWARETCTVRSYAFNYCNNLTTVNFCTGSSPSSFATGTYGGFSNCPNLTEVHVPQNAWYGVTSWDSKTVIKDLPDHTPSAVDTVLQVQTGEYQYTKNIGTIPSSFGRNNSSVYRVEIGNNATTIGTYCFNNCTAWREIEFKGNVLTSIGTGSFGKNRNINQSNIVFPDSVQTFGQDVFNTAGSGGFNTAIDYFYFGTSTSSFGSQSFAGNTGVTRVDLNCLNPPTGAPFRYNTTLEFHVPSNSTFGTTYGYENNTVVKDLPAI